MVILARAVFKFTGAQSDDLSFDEDDVITVLEKDDSGWWIGKNDAGQQGEFPFNYVELLSEKETQAHLKKKEQGEAEMNFQGERVDTIQVVQINAPAAGGKPFACVLESSTTSGSREQVTKGMVEIRAFDAQLRTVLPDFEGKLPPVWSDKAVLPEHATERRKEAMDVYVQKLVCSEGADFLLVPFLFPGKSVELSADSFHSAARAQQQAKEMASHKKADAPPTLARAEYAWEPQDPVELSLESEEVVAVLSQNTGSEGWWEGQTADGQRGLFPCNHVDVLSPPDVINYLEGRPVSAPRFTPAPSPSERVKKNHIPKTSDRPVKLVRNFTITTLQAFDDMIDKGVAVENISGNGNGVMPKPGDFVSLEFKAHLWESQALAIIEFLASDDKDEGPLQFVVGDDAGVCQGLHTAIQKLQVGMSARVIIAPKMGYGVAGSPPVIPPLAHLIYDITLLSVTDNKTMTSTPKQKPEVKKRSESIAPRVLSMRNLLPIGNRAEAGKAKASAPSTAHQAAHATVIAAASTDHQGGARRAAGHVMLGGGGGKGGAAPPVMAPPAKPEVPKFDLKNLQDIVATNQITEKGLNRNNLEDYLSDKAFFEAFLMDRGHFLLKPLWRQQALKRAVGMF